MNKEIPVACCHTVFTKEQRVEYKRIWSELETRRIAIVELANGHSSQYKHHKWTIVGDLQQKLSVDK